MAIKLKPCRCGSLVERHMDDKGKVFVYCSDCGLAFGISLDCCAPFSTGEAIFETAEQAAAAWNDWITGGENDDN